MTELDGELPELAVELIDEYGKAVEYVIVGEAVYDKATAKTTAPKTPVEGVKILPPEGYSAYQVAGSGGLVEIADKKLTTAAAYFNGLEPTAGDKVSFDGVEYTVMKVDTIYSGELPCLYVLQVRA